MHQIMLNNVFARNQQVRENGYRPSMVVSCLGILNFADRRSDFDMESPKLRQASQDDEEFTYRVKRAGLKEYVALVWGWDEVRQRQIHARRYTEQDLLIVEVDGKDVGIMSVAIEPDCVFVNQLYLLPEHQGQGIGRTCMLVVVEQANSLGLPVRLQVLQVNARAVAFYKRLGFEITGVTDTHLLMQLESSPS